MHKLLLKMLKTKIKNETQTFDQISPTEGAQTLFIMNWKKHFLK